MGDHKDAPAGYPHLHHLTSPLRKAAVATGDVQVAHLWAGTDMLTPVLAVLSTSPNRSLPDRTDLRVHNALTSAGQGVWLVDGSRRNDSPSVSMILSRYGRHLVAR